MENKNYLPAAIIGLAVVIGAGIWSYSFYQSRTLDQNLSVTGSAEKIVMSDTVKWTSNITSFAEGNNLKAGNAKLVADAEMIKAYFKNNGVREGEITFNPPSISPVCENQSNVSWDKFGNQTCGSGKLSGYNIQQTMIIESDRVKEVAELSQKATQYFIDKGAVFSSQGLEYYYNKLSDLRLQMLADATKNAKDRAEQIVYSTGSKLGSMRSASTGVFQVNAKNSVEVSDYGVYDTSSIEKKVTAIMKVTFQVK